jgi:hypothetical protein
MNRQQRIRYCIDLDTGQVISKVGEFWAWPILDFDHMRPENNFEVRYFLEKLSDRVVWGSVPIYVKWTRKIPTCIKNLHRRFWGMRPLDSHTDPRQPLLGFGSV